MYRVIPAARTHVAVLATVAVLAAMLALARVYATFPGDEWALQQLHQLRTPWLTGAAISASTVGQAGIGWGLAVPWIPLAAIAAGLAMRRWADAAFLALATLAPLVNLGIKELVAGPRPDADLWLIAETGFAFPSGHTVFAASFLGALAWLTGRAGILQTRPVARRTIQTSLVLLILAVGFSRVYLGVHWPSDVIGGFLFGGLYLSVLASARFRLESRHQAGAQLRRKQGDEQFPKHWC